MDFLTGLLLGSMFGGETKNKTPRPKMYKFVSPKRPQKPSSEEIKKHKSQSLRLWKR